MIATMIAMDRNTILPRILRYCPIRFVIPYGCLKYYNNNHSCVIFIIIIIIIIIIKRIQRRYVSVRINPSCHVDHTTTIITILLQTPLPQRHHVVHIQIIQPIYGFGNHLYHPLLVVIVRCRPHIPR